MYAASAMITGRATTVDDDNDDFAATDTNAVDDNAFEYWIFIDLIKRDFFLQNA